MTWIPWRNLISFGKFTETRALQLAAQLAVQRVSTWKVFSSFAPRSPTMQLEQFLALGERFGLLPAAPLAHIYERHMTGDAMTFAQFRDAIYDVAVTVDPRSQPEVAVHALLDRLRVDAPGATTSFGPADRTPAASPTGQSPTPLRDSLDSFAAPPAALQPSVQPVVQAALEAEDEPVHPAARMSAQPLPRAVVVAVAGCPVSRT